MLGTIIATIIAFFVVCSSEGFGASGSVAATPPPPPPFPPVGPCTSDAGCSLCGACNQTSGVCRCDKGFTGVHCDILNMGRPLKCGQGGLCMHGEHVGSNSGVEPTTGYSTWGGSVVPNADFSEYHMWASMFQWNASLEPPCEYGGGGNNTCAGWISNSDVVHAVSNSPGGPYTAVDIALGPRGNIVRQANCSYKGGIPGYVCGVVQANDYWDALTAHTPGAQRDPVTGYYLIYYMGTMQNASNKKAGFPCLTNDTPPQPSDRASGAYCQQRVGLAVSKDPSGPWLRYDHNGEQCAVLRAACYTMVSQPSACPFCLRALMSAFVIRCDDVSSLVDC